MIRYIVRRLLSAVPVLLAVYTIVFLLIHATPGGPWSSEKSLPPAVIKNLNAKFSLDQPLWKQYVIYLRNLVQGDLGPSYRQRNRTVTEIILDFFPVSLQLGLVSMLIALILGLSLGVISALNQNTWVDYAATVVATIGISVPEYVTAPFLVIVLSLSLNLLPTSGWDGVFSLKIIIPALALSFGLAAALARFTRASMLEVLRQDYIRTGRAKGLAERAIVIRHALKNALIPVVTVAGSYLAFIITGSFFVETIYGVPGIGRYFITSITARDYPVIMGTVLLLAMVAFVLNLLVDIMYAFLDPRVRYQ
jgi:oligopeptide transport system permease protein